ncbi:MAG TPA: MarR family transcriptional regulator [Actinomycetes bacterium]|nr:MarR family transcriptional regulator [Actinomycetes bacterium]
MTGRPATDTTAQDLEAIERAFTRFARRLVQRPLHEAHMAAAGLPLDRAAYSLLARLGECGPVRVSELAQRLGVNASTTSRQVQLLERERLIRRATDPVDRRAAILELTGEGRVVLERLRRHRSARLAALLEPWPAEDRHRLAVLLTRFLDDVERAQPPGRQPAAAAAGPRPGRIPDPDGGQPPDHVLHLEEPA